MGETYLYVHTVAKRLKCSDKTVYRLIQDGKIPAIRIGGRALRIPAQEFEDYLSGCVVDPDSAVALP